VTVQGVTHTVNNHKHPLGASKIFKTTFDNIDCPAPQSTYEVFHILYYKSIYGMQVTTNADNAALCLARAATMAEVLYT